MTKILVIDDEHPTLEMFRLFLGAYGYSVFTADNGVKGLEVFRKEKPSIVITDVKMPGTDGLEVLKRIKEINPMAEVIVSTGHGDADLEIKALHLDATDFINKPVDRHSLEAALKRAEKRLELSRKEEKEITWRTVESVAVMDFRGNITSASEPVLLNAYDKILEMKPTGILLNFDYHSSINGAGIAVLIRILTDCKKRSRPAAVSGLSENFRKIFHIVGIAKLAVIFDNEEDALTRLIKRH